MKESEIDNIIGGHVDTTSLFDENKPEQTAEIQVDTSKPYTCDVCQKSFSTQLALTGHKRSHGIGVTKKEKIENPQQNKVESIQLPADYQILLDALKRWSIPKADAIAQAMTLTHLDDFAKLRELLVSLSVVANLREGFLTYWQGVRNAINQRPATEHKNNDLTSLDDDLAFEQKLYRMQVYKEARSTGHKNNNEPNAEVASLRAQIMEMKDLLVRQKAEQELALLKKDLEESKQESGGRVSQIADMVKEFVLSQRHESEMLRKDLLHEREIQLLREEMRAAGAGTTLGEKMLEKIDRTLNNMGSGLGELSKYNVGVEKADRVAALVNMGVPVQQAVAVVDTSNRPPPLINARQEWENLNRVVNIPPVPKPQEKPPEPVQFTEPIEKVKFADASNE